MKNLLTVLIVILWGTITTNGQITKTLSRSIDLGKTHTTYLNLPGEVKVTEWEEGYLRILSTIEVENMTEGVVKRLLMTGRYSLEVKTDKYEKQMALMMPNSANFVTVKGVDLIEQYTFEVKVPKGYRVIVLEKGTTACPKELPSI